MAIFQESHVVARRPPPSRSPPALPPSLPPNPALVVLSWQIEIPFYVERGGREGAEGGRRDVCPLLFPSSTWVAVILLHGFDAPRRRRWPQNRLQRPTLSWEKSLECHSTSISRGQSLLYRPLFATDRYEQGSAERCTPGWVSGAGKFRQKWEARAATKFAKPGGTTF